MKLIKAKIKNFGSYKDLEIDYQNQGLSLVYGPTGSGKSTFQDLASWIIYGITGKDLSVDDIRPWGCEELTEGTLQLEVNNQLINIIRKRGISNDLFWEENDEIHRGKDLKDTQRLLEEKLGIYADQYITSCYFHEFSPVGSFFTAKAKDRRELFEQLADLEFPTRLSAALSDSHRDLGRDLRCSMEDRSRLYGVLPEIQRSMGEIIHSSDRWEEEKTRKIHQINEKKAGFEIEKASKIKYLVEKEVQENKEYSDKLINIRKLVSSLEMETDGQIDLPLQLRRSQEHLQALKASLCPTCGGPDRAQQVEAQHAEINRLRRLQMDLERSKANYEHARQTEAELSKNPPGSYKDKLAEARQSVSDFYALLLDLTERENPYVKLLQKKRQHLEENEGKLREIEHTIQQLEAKLSSFEQLTDLVAALRIELLKNCVQKIQNDTNNSLEKHFDAEIRVAFALAEGDKLDISIYKDGNLCNFKQLSKGQRQLLKLCFVISVMEASASKIGQQFNVLFFDEALDGLDGELKVKAFSLFQNLSKDHESVYLIDHSPDLLQMFDKRYHATLINGESTLICE